MTPGAHVFRASFKAFAPLLLFLPAPLVLGFLTALHLHDWLGVLVLFGVPFAFCLSLLRFRLVLTPEQVYYRAVFHRVRTLRRSEVVSVGLASPDRSILPLTLLVRSSNGEQLRVKLNVFSTEAAKLLFRLGRRTERRVPVPMSLARAAFACRLNTVRLARYPFSDFSLQRVRR